MNSRIYPKNLFEDAIIAERKRKETYFKKEILIEKKIYTDYELKRIKLIEQHRIKINELNNINK